MHEEYRERPYRARKPAYREPRADTATFALASQMVIMIAMLLCVGIVKKTDEAKYLRFKEQYQIMVSADSEVQKAEKWILGGEGLFSGIAGFVKGFWSELLSTGTAEERLTPGGSIVEAEPESGAEAQAGPESLKTSRQGALFLPRLTVWANDLPEEKSAVPADGLLYLRAPGSPVGTRPLMAAENGVRSMPYSAPFSPVYTKSAMVPPASGIITSGFSYRTHPVTGKKDFHTGIDIAAPAGGDIVAAKSGTVTRTGESAVYGKYIILSHAEGLETSYSHCSEIVVGKGAFVKQGEPIAKVGDTGVTTGPHLHFSVIMDGDYANPAWILGGYIEAIR